MSCLCACENAPAEQKATLAAILRQEQRELSLLAVQSDMWKAGRIGLEARGVPVDQPARAVQHNRVQQSRRAQAVGEKWAVVPPKEGRSALASSKNPRFRRHVEHKALEEKHEQVMKVLAYNAMMKQEAARKLKQAASARVDRVSTDAQGFNWNRMEEKRAGKLDPAMVALGREAGKIDNVYDPTEDPDNLGPDYNTKNAQWWSADSTKESALQDHWWEHGGEQGMTR